MIQFSNWARKCQQADTTVFKRYTKLSKNVTSKIIEQYDDSKFFIAEKVKTGSIYSL